jgi:hypothetical protein
MFSLQLAEVICTVPIVGISERGICLKRAIYAVDLGIMSTKRVPWSGYATKIGVM